VGWPKLVTSPTPESVSRAVGGRIVSRVLQVPYVQFVSTQGVGGNSTLDDGSLVDVVPVMVLLRGHSRTGDEESGRSGRNKKSSHDIPRFLVLNVELDANLITL
jgi:hypothetical protein